MGLDLYVFFKDFKFIDIFNEVDEFLCKYYCFGCRGFNVSK